MMTQLLRFLPALFLTPAISLACDLAKLRTDFESSLQKIKTQLPQYYEKNFRLDTAAIKNHMATTQKLRTCEKQSAQEQTPCDLRMDLKHAMGFNLTATYEFYINTTSQGTCYTPVNGFERVDTKKRLVAYSVGRLWVFSPQEDVVCKNSKLKTTRRTWMVSGTESDTPAGIFVIDFPYPDDLSLPDTLFWGRQIHFRGRQSLQLNVLDKDTIRFQWSSGAWLELETATSHISRTNVVAPSMYGPACQTSTAEDHFIPFIEFLPEGLGFVEKVEDISS